MARTRLVQGVPWPMEGQGRELGRRVDADLRARFQVGAVRSKSDYRRYLGGVLGFPISTEALMKLCAGMFSPRSELARRAALHFGVCTPAQFPEDWAAMEAARATKQD